MNTTTKPLFEETLNIVFECFGKYRNGQPILPVECLKNYQLIYNEDDDVQQSLRDDNQLCSEHLAIRYATKESTSRTSLYRTQLRVTTSRISTHQNETVPPIDHSKINTNIVLPLINMSDVTSPVAEKVIANSSVVSSVTANPLPGDVTPAYHSIASSGKFIRVGLDELVLIAGKLTAAGFTIE